MMAKIIRYLYSMFCCSWITLSLQDKFLVVFLLLLNSTFMLQLKSPSFVNLPLFLPCRTLQFSFDVHFLFRHALQYFLIACTCILFYIILQKKLASSYDRKLELQLIKSLKWRRSQMFNHAKLLLHNLCS